MDDFHCRPCCIGQLVFWPFYLLKTFSDINGREICDKEKERVLETECDSAETDRMEGGEERSAGSQTETRLKLQAET